ncbi:MAG: response regulator transcription factor, partial [Gammaproteobacteria bacterium]|nr:response regulator transcription factor [Gammaproteobacteria bacterium]
MKLLIAEDDLTSRSMLEAVTGKWGFDVVAVEDGEAAWEILQQADAPLLLLLDWEMPKLTGLELCKRVRQQQTDMPAFIILLTSRSSVSDIVSGLEAGANEYIAKPFDNTELHARLEVGRRMLNLQIKNKQAEEKQALLTNQLQQAQKMEAIGQ